MSIYFKTSFMEILVNLNSLNFQLLFTFPQIIASKHEQVVFNSQITIRNLYIVAQAMSRIYICLIIICALFLLTSCDYKSAPYAQWAHSHLVWLNSGDQNQQKMYKLVKDYKQHGIPVGAINIDSVWSECQNNFIVDRKKFPNLETLIKDMHAQNVRVILWATSIVNKECPQFQEGVAKKYFLNHGKTVHWWHGQGAFVDFFNPAARAWFQKLMDRVLDIGVDGWKCDGADPLIYLLRPLPYSPGLKRYITFPQYAHQYYGTFYNHTKSKNPDGLVMSRPVDGYKGLAYVNYSPKYVMFMGWVGDQHNDVQGFKNAMENIIHSASQDYLNFGLDIGGYKTSGDSKKYLFLRWVQIGSLLPFMENGGGGKHQPWLFDQETVDIYRKFTLLHYDLHSFFLTSGTEAYKKGKSVLQPITIDKKKIQLSNNYNLGYVLWNTFLVSPIFEESGFVEVVFPKGYKWIYYFDHSRIYEGGATRYLGIKLDQTALFMRSNSIIPIKGQLWLVHLGEGSYNKTVIAGDYSDDVLVQYKEQKLEIKVLRFYKNEEVRRQRTDDTSIKVRLIGLGNKPTLVKSDNQQHQNVFKPTEYDNEFEIEIQFNETVIMQKIQFHRGKQ